MIPDLLGGLAAECTKGKKEILDGKFFFALPLQSGRPFARGYRLQFVGKSLNAVHWTAERVLSKVLSKEWNPPAKVSPRKTLRTWWFCRSFYETTFELCRAARIAKPARADSK